MKLQKNLARLQQKHMALAVAVDAAQKLLPTASNDVDLKKLKLMKCWVKTMIESLQIAITVAQKDNPFDTEGWRYQEPPAPFPSAETTFFAAPVNLTDLEESTTKAA